MATQYYSAEHLLSTVEVSDVMYGNQPFYAYNSFLHSVRDKVDHCSSIQFTGVYLPLGNRY